MATAFETLSGNSSLPVNGTNTTWDFLLTQQGGSGISQVLLFGPVSANITGVASSSVSSIRVAADINTVLSASINSVKLTAKINTTTGN